MSAQEVRNEIIRENLPKLIKELTGFKDDDENMRHCEHFAWSIIRSHRNLSTNSHEVRRAIESIQEKFKVDNCPEYANHLGRLCDGIVYHSLCINHYEVDVHWSLLDFMFALAYNPTGALRRNKEKIDKCLKAIPKSDEVPVKNDAEYWKNALKEDFIPVPPLSDSASELSDWSDHSEEDRSSDNALSSPKEAVRSTRTSTCAASADIKPPEKESTFVLYDGELSKERLLESVQSSWWLPAADKDNMPLPSEEMAANFATKYNHFLTEISHNLMRFEKPSTVSEFCLLRELVWMFNKPLTCKFFIVHGNDIKVRPNVSVPSVSVNGLEYFIKQHFIPPIKMMFTLRQFVDSIYKCEEFTPPKTLESYASSLQSLLTPFWKRLLDFEARLIAQRDFEVNTIISFLDQMRGPFGQLRQIYKLHHLAVLNLRQLPAHITSAYLLSRLMKSNQMATNATDANLAISLFLASVKVYCTIIDKWWTEGRLDDWQKEFLVERVSASDQKVCVRLFEKNKTMAFFVPSHVTKMITESDFFSLLLEHSLEAGTTLNLLYEINRISDLSNSCESIEGQLYDVFLDDVLECTRAYQSQVATVPPEKSAPATESTDVCDVTTSHLSTSCEVLQSLSTTDQFLRVAFASHCNIRNECETDSTDAAPTQSSNRDALSMFQQFERTRQILPFQEIVLSSLTRILKARIAFANSFVMRLYREEFYIHEHLLNLRRVMMLEACDLMQQFYEKLFTQIELGKPWANPYQLTMQLDDIISTKFPQMSSLFRIEINATHRCETLKVVEAVDEIIVTYNLSRELAQIITPADIVAYNRVFRFLLKVKWALQTLEQLRFPRNQKRRIPYAPYHMSDMLMRRLAQLRFWMIYAMQSLHFYLTTQVLQSMGAELDEKISNCTNLKEMETAHKLYINTICKHCFLADYFNPIMLGIDQLLSLTYVVRMEWTDCSNYIEQNDPLAPATSDSGSGVDSSSDYVANSQLGAIEVTYIRCHQFLANKLNNAVYLRQHTFLSGLSAAFNTSLPH